MEAGYDHPSAVARGQARNIAGLPNASGIMDSINRRQQEENHADLTGAQAIEKIKDLMVKRTV